MADQPAGRRMSARPMPPSPESVQRVLIVHLAGLGDLVLALPMLAAVRRHFVNARVAVLTYPHAAQLLDDRSLVDEVYRLDSAWSSALWRTLRHLRRQRFDLVINGFRVTRWQGALKTLALLTVVGGRVWVGRDTDGRGFFYDGKVPEPSAEPVHELEAALRVAGWLGAAPPADRAVDLRVPSEARERIRQHLADAGVAPGERLVGMHCGVRSARYPGRQPWPVERWAALADAVRERSQVTVVLTGFASEAAIGAQVQRLVRRPCVNLIGRTRLDELMALLQSVQAYVSCDAGPSHLAWVLGCPLVVLMDPSQAARYRPYHPRACAIPVVQPIASITVDQVLQAVATCLAEPRP